MYTFLSDADVDGIAALPAAELLAWTARAGAVLSAEHLFFPVNEASDHWALVVARPAERTVDYYDSLFGYDDAIRPTLLVQRYLERLAAELEPDGAPGATWTRRVVTRCSKQDNPSDCGLFVCRYIECLLDGEPTEFSPIAGKQYRSKVIETAFENRLGKDLM
jgi:sentrin-specific protease 1